jgi:hypothetical protein
MEPSSILHRYISAKPRSTCMEPPSPMTMVRFTIYRGEKPTAAIAMSLTQLHRGTDGMRQSYCRSRIIGRVQMMVRIAINRENRL